MARGGKRVQRGKRAKGISGSSTQQSGTSFAQSGGIANTFAGTSGGGAYGGRFGGSDGQKVKDTGKLANGQPYRVRGPGGDTTLVKGGLPRPAPANLHSLSGTGDKVPTKKYNRGAAKGAGGSNQ